MDRALQAKLWDEPEFLLISLKPVFYQMIVCGKKDVEFRTVFPDRPTQTFVYVKQPLAAINCLLDLARPVADPRLLSDRHGHGVDDFRGGKKPGRKALPIERVYKLIRPVPLTEMRSYDINPPQSYMYLKKRPRFLKLLVGLLPESPCRLERSE